MQKNRLSQMATAALLATSILWVSGASPVLGAAEDRTGYELNKDTGQPFHFHDYTKATVLWALWPLCNGVVMYDGEVVSGKRANYCILSVKSQKKTTAQSQGTAGEWTTLAAKQVMTLPNPAEWKEDWSQPRSQTGYATQIYPVVKTVNYKNSPDVHMGLEAGDGADITNRLGGVAREVNPEKEYQITLNVGSLDLFAMAITGQQGRISSSKATNGDNILTVSGAPDSASLIDYSKGQPDECTDNSLSAMWSPKSYLGMKLLGATAHPEEAKIMRGTVIESDATVFDDRNAQKYLPTWDAELGEFRLKVCAPHFRDDGKTLNTGYYRILLTPTMLSSMGYALQLPEKSEEALAKAQSEAKKDFEITADDGQAPPLNVELVKNADDTYSIFLSGEIHYSGPTVSVNRTRPAAWPISPSATIGKQFIVRYELSKKLTGIATLSIKNSAGKVVALSSKSVKASDKSSMSVLIPKSLKPGRYTAVVSVKPKSGKATSVRPVQIVVAKK